MRSKAKRSTSKSLIDHLVRRIVTKFQPNQVILFGSQARGEAGPDSDIDLLVVMDFEGSVTEKRLEICMALPNIPIPVDVVLTTPASFAWRKDIVGTIEYPATREGKVLYARPR